MAARAKGLDELAEARLDLVGGVGAVVTLEEIQIDLEGGKQRVGGVDGIWHAGFAAGDRLLEEVHHESVHPGVQRAAVQTGGAVLWSTPMDDHAELRGVLLDPAGDADQYGFEAI
jgi:hypothetical protein